MKNRFVIQPMECDDAQEDGAFSELSIKRYERLMRGGAGMVIVESVTMQYEARARIDQILIDISDENNKKEWAAFAKKMKEASPDTLLICQLNHSGEVSAGNFSRPGSKPSKRLWAKPLYGFTANGEEMTEEYVDETLKLYIDTSKFLYDIGFDGVDIKCCHGYFISQLLRPYNDREWKYGGSWENRSRFAFELVEGIRKEVPDENFLIGAKVSMYEGMPGGQGHAGPDSPIIDFAEPISLIQGLEERGCSFFIESLGNPSVDWELMSPNRKNAFDVYNHMSCADLMKKNLKPETLVVVGGTSILSSGMKNGMRGVTPEQNNLFYWGNYLIEHGNCDALALGRQSIADPALPEKYLEGKEDEIHYCMCCDGCSELMIRQSKVGCIVHDSYYRDLILKLRKEKRHVRIVTGDE